MRDRRTLIAALLVFALALVLRILFLVDLLPSPFFDHLLIDPAAYDSWGQRIADGDIWGRGVFYQAPLYAYFLGGLYALFGRDLLIVRVAQTILGSLTCVLLLFVTSRAFSFRTGVVAGIVAALYTTFVFQDVMLLKSAVVLFFLVLSLFRLGQGIDRNSLFVLGQAGFLFGIAITGRGNLIFAVPLLAAWLLLRGERPLAGTPLRAAGVFLLGTALAIAPVTLRNRVVGGDWVLVESDAGINVYVGNNPAATGIHTPPFDIRTVPEHEEQDAARFAERETGRRLKPSEVSGFWVEKALRFALSHPRDEAGLLWRKLLLAWNGYEVPDNYDQAYFAKSSWTLRGYLPGFLWVSPFAALGFILSIRAWRRAGFLHLFVLAYLLSLLALYVTSRYRLPILVGLIPLAAHGIVRFVRMLRSREWKSAAPSGALLAAVFFVGTADLVEHQGFAKEETEIATFYADRGENEAAERAFERAIEEARGSGTLHLVYMNQGFFLGRLGRTAEAEEAFRNALRANPSFTPARIELEKLQANLEREGRPSSSR